MSSFGMNYEGRCIRDHFNLFFFLFTGVDEKEAVFSKPF